MKPQEAELVSEISKLQCMVTELKTGFTSALLELSQIQHGDSFLREEVEESRRSCQKKALRLEALVEALREELGVMRCQVVQLNRLKPQQEGKSVTSKQRERESDPAEPQQVQRDSAAAAGLSRGKLLLHCFLQGLKAGLSEGTDARHQVAMQLLHSEWEYVSTLNQLYDKYKTPPTRLTSAEPQQTYVKFVEQLLQRHLLFRNTLQERLSAEHWKSLVGDILVQLIGQNETAFSDAYLGYTTTLASLLSLEFNRLNHPDNSRQGAHIEREEMKLLSLLLAPVARVHAYLSHIQNLLQWTGKEHPDCSLLLGAERALRAVLSRCHVILEEDVRWEDEDAAGPSCCDAAAASSSAHCCRRSRQTTSSRENQPGPAKGVDRVDRCHSMRVECWSCSPVRRTGCGPDRAAFSQTLADCGHAYCSSLLITPHGAGWAENSDSGQGTSSQPTVKGTNGLEPPRGTRNLQDCETDPDDTSAFDYSSVTSCSPDGTLRREGRGSNSGVEEEEEEEEQEEEEEEEEDSQVPVLLKPCYSQLSPSETPRERTVCLRWQIPRMTPHPPLRGHAGPYAEGPRPGPGPGPGPGPCLVSSYGKRLVSVRKGSPPLHPKSAFRPIWDDPSKQADSAPEKDNRPQGFIPIQTAAAAGRQNFQSFNPSRENLRPGVLWDDSEDSEGPCSTV